VGAGGIATENVREHALAAARRSADRHRRSGGRYLRDPVARSPDGRRPSADQAAYVAGCGKDAAPVSATATARPGLVYTLNEWAS